MSDYGPRKTGPRKAEKPQEYREYHVAPDDYREDHKRFMSKPNLAGQLRIQKHRFKLFNRGREEIEALEQLISEC